MRYSLVVCFIVIVAFATIGAQKAGCVKEICPVRERYQCCGSCIQRTCALEDDTTCPDVCYKGCYCKKGYVRKYAPDGPCIRQDNSVALSFGGLSNPSITGGRFLPSVTFTTPSLADDGLVSGVDTSTGATSVDLVSLRKYMYADPMAPTVPMMMVNHLTVALNLSPLGESKQVKGYLCAMLPLRQWSPTCGPRTTCGPCR
uniref:TIL domain-containing protein n=1 Tax=Anopheles melas TaxID=34690 RepID=A0A182U5I3_9DIPT